MREVRLNGALRWVRRTLPRVLLLLVFFPLSAAELNPHILRVIEQMPIGGGYAADRTAEQHFARSGVVWREQEQRLVVSPRDASPTFCSAACYMVLLRALQDCESRGDVQFPPSVWRALRVEWPHPDGVLSWGRFNANGPGCAVWAHDLGAGINFCSPFLARPGDFLKFFFTEHLGVSERGHLVIFLGLVQNGGEKCIRFWSSNKPGGYGVRSLPLRSLHHLIFTRIIRPERIRNVLNLPASDSWLGSLLRAPTDWDTVCRRCGIAK